MFRDPDDPTVAIRDLLLDWLRAEAALAGEFYAVCHSDYDELNAKGQIRAADFGIAWDDDLEEASRGDQAIGVEPTHVQAPTRNFPPQRDFMRRKPPIVNYGEVVICPHRGQWFIVDGMEDDGSVYLLGDHEFLGPIPIASLTNLGPTVDRFWLGDGYATGNHWELVDGAKFPNLRTCPHSHPRF